MKSLMTKILSNLSTKDIVKLLALALTNLVLNGQPSHQLDQT